MTDLDAIKNRLAAVHAAGASGITVRLADHGIRVLVQMQSWEGNTAHEAHGAVTHLLGHAPADLTALVAEVERLHAEEAYRLQLLDDAGGIENERDALRVANTVLLAERDLYREAWADALRDERAAVVEWLREYAAPSHSDADNLAVSAPGAATVGRLADAIERGEHRRKENE